MSNYNTGNPVPSDDPRDLDDNATNLDNFINGIAASYLDRLGVSRKSYAGLEAAFNALLTNNNLAALAGLTGVADRMAYFTGAGAMALATLTPQARQLLDDTSFVAMLVTLGAAARGANGDITSLTGLTTALSVLQGGTGVTTVAAQLAALLTVGAYSKTNILGTVSQTGGVPTGSIIQSGTAGGGTGDYTLFADGRLECRRRTNHSGIAMTTALGSQFYLPAGLGALNFAWPFVTGSIPLVHTQLMVVGGAVDCRMTSDPTNVTGPNVLPINNTSATQNMIRYELAIGRWF